MSKKALVDILQTIQDETQGDKISFEDVIQALNHRGFGPMLVAPALIGILPTGAIPFMPNVVALFVLLIAVQILLGRTKPWMPKRIKNFSFSRQAYQNAYKKFRPYALWIDGFFHPRFEFLTGEMAQKLIAVMCIGLALSIVVLAFIPFMAAIPCMAILLFGLGVSVHDGLLSAIGVVFMMFSFLAIPLMWSSLPF